MSERGRGQERPSRSTPVCPLPPNADMAGRIVRWSTRRCRWAPAHYQATAGRKVTSQGCRTLHCFESMRAGMWATTNLETEYRPCALYRHFDKGDDPESGARRYSRSSGKPTLTADAVRFHQHRTKNHTGSACAMCQRTCTLSISFRKRLRDLASVLDEKPSNGTERAVLQGKSSDWYKGKRKFNWQSLDLSAGSSWQRRLVMSLTSVRIRVACPQTWVICLLTSPVRFASGLIFCLSQQRQMGPNERRPGGCALALWSRRQTVALQHIANRAWPRKTLIGVMTGLTEKPIGRAAGSPVALTSLIDVRFRLQDQAAAHHSMLQNCPKPAITLSSV